MPRPARVKQQIERFRQQEFQKPTTTPTVNVSPPIKISPPIQRKPRKVGLSQDLRDKLVELRRVLKTVSKWARFTNDKGSTYYRPQNLELWEALAALEEVLK